MSNKPILGDNRLPELFERWTAQEAAREEQSEWFKTFFAEAKALGYNPKTMRAAFKRQRNPDATEKLVESEAEIALYMDALARVRIAGSSEPKEQIVTNVPVTAPAPKPKPVFKPWLNNSKGAN